jgi:hypothetical protein
MEFADFLGRWQAAGPAERANKDLFLSEFCRVLEVEEPRPKTNDPEKDLYVFEKEVSRPNESGASIGRIDLYRAGCFVLEAKQVDAAKRESPAWHQAMNDALGQALGYSRSLPSPPPFVVVCDIGYCFDLYASFDGSGAYRPFPDGFGKRLYLAAFEAHREKLRKLWIEPLELDPARQQAKVTREVAAKVAALARELESGGHDPRLVAEFLMRCLFTMFAEDTGLLPQKLFSKQLHEYWLPNPPSFPGGVGALWRAMNDGAETMSGKLLRFNGGLLAGSQALPLTKKQLELLAEAAKSDWAEVDPSIFGTLLERALSPAERHQLGAHYTPRAYVERLVRPTIEEPLREDWDLVRAEVRQLVESQQTESAKAEAARAEAKGLVAWSEAAGKLGAEAKQAEAVARKKIELAQQKVLDFHHALCKTRVLDPACGTGNFLYVTLDLFKRLESEVLEQLRGLGYEQIDLEMEKYRVTPEQFRGIEVKPWAKEIAELVLWIGYLQWQVRQSGSPTAVPQPVLRDYGNIECRDAVLAWDGDPELARDEHGKPITRWDGITYKKSPVTGEDIPDETATIPVYIYKNPKPAEWPKADFIVGNPPFIGNKRMRGALSDGYVEALRDAHPTVPETADYVLYWWARAAELVASRRARRFGLITTNSIAQVFNRRVLESALKDGRLSVIFAIPDHPWVDASEGAAVRVAMTVGASGATVGQLGTLSRASVEGGEVPSIEFSWERGRILADLRVGADIGSSKSLLANGGLSFMGVILVGQGFLVDEDDPIRLSEPGGLRPFLVGNEMNQAPKHRYVIDFFGLSAELAKRSYPALFQRVIDRVKPERDANRDTKFRELWWLHGRSRGEMRAALSALSRFIGICRTARHLVFQLVSTNILVESKVVAIALEDPVYLGVLSSRIHLVWAGARGSKHGVGNDFTYNNTSCFDTFPFPVCGSQNAERIRALGGQLNAHRKQQLALHSGLTITGMYNVLEKLRSGKALTAKEKVIHEQGLVSVLKQIHDELDAAVFEAYGWPTTLSDEEILERLVALNHERAEEEKRGIVRWLRPEFQNPGGAKVAVQEEIPGASKPVTRKGARAKQGAAGAGTGTGSEKRPWPKELPAQVAAVRDLLSEKRSLSLDAARKSFQRANEGALATALDSLAALGLAVVQGEGAERVWSAAG